MSSCRVDTLALTELAEQRLHDGGASWMRREVAVVHMSVRADIAAIVHGRIVMVEIKGPSDRTARLSMQLHGYGAVADRVELLCAPNLVEACSAVVDDHLAFVRVSSVERTLREPTRPTPRVLRQVLSLHLRPEVEALAVARGCARGVRGKSKPTIVERLIKDGITVDEARDSIVAAWPGRDWDWFNNPESKR